MKAWAAEAWEAIKDWLLTLYLAAMEVVEWLHDLSNEKPWVSWLIHGIMAIPCCYLGWWVQAFMLWLGADARRAYFVSVATAVFAYRELEQMLHRLRTGQPLLPLDHTMDVVSAQIGALLAA